MKKGAMVRMINLMGGNPYYNFTWTYLGLSSGSKMYHNYADYTPHGVININQLCKN